MFAVLTCIFVQHDLRLVAVAAAICSIACCSAFAFHARGLKASGAIRWAWLAMSALAAGSGVWATHFVAMLAYQPTMKIAYDLTGTALSLVVAVLGMGIGFSLPAWRPGKARDRNVALIAGAAAGASIAVMHYTGIAAIRTEADVSWSMAYVAASILIAATGGMAAFSVRNVLDNRWAWAPPAGIFLLGIVGLHFTAMTAVTLTPDPTLVVAGPVMDRAGLALATGALAVLVLAAGAALLLMERLGQRNTFGSVRHALNAVPAGLAFFDPSDRVQVWNGAYAALMADCGIVVEAGLPRRSHIEAAAAAGWFPEIQPGQPGWVATLTERAHSGGSEFHLPDGRWLRHESFRTADGGGVAVLTDITEQKQSAAAMAAARDAAEAANRAKSEFLANMSHEIRTPLNGVLGIADVLVRTDLSAEQRSLVGVIQQSGGLLNGLLTDLLDLARVEAGAAELRPEPSALDVLVGSVRDLFAASAAEKGLTLRTLVDLGEGVVDCDAQRLRQVLGNLLNNAIKFTEAGEVVLSAERVGRRVRFAVRDTGPGFDAAHRETLFQRFRQADNSQTRKHGGAGLGLAICDQYVRLMGGTLSCESAPGEGAAFDFTLDLPLHAEPVEAGAPATNATPTAELSTDYRVLVVDDNAVNRQVMALILDSVGIAYASAEDGAEGLAAMQTGDFDAVLMDIQMPVMDGFEATRRIREWEREAGRSRAPILMVSANCLKEHVDAGRAAGADRHLGKPISAAELIAALETQMAQVRRAA
ncbi:ATP-binding protein [Phenylobacterium sp.]|uniref:ATP-binding protein n=1 Tax=Phenylobacterium sp. TaxID=1871053 RepID=UPI002E300570|nr:MHYT domain-containing protein [Phenylobacterium sp.]HEX3363708.1 MHYT domain-containing protein [Phenylobacterium sp.]